MRAEYNYAGDIKLYKIMLVAAMVAVVVGFLTIILIAANPFNSFWISALASCYTGMAAGFLFTKARYYDEKIKELKQKVVKNGI